MYMFPKVLGRTVNKDILIMVTIGGIFQLIPMMSYPIPLQRFAGNTLV